MLAAVCGAALSCAVEKLSEFSIQRVGIPDEIKSNVERLQEELDFMHSFIKDVEEIQGGDNRTQSWVRAVTNIANETLSALDDFQLKIGSGDPTHLDRARSLIVRYSEIDIGERIKSIFVKLEDLARRKKSYGIPNINSDVTVGESSASIAVKSLRRTTSYLEANQVLVGRDDIKKKLTAGLLKDDCRRSVVSIYGTGGSGKTSLASSLYNSEEIRSKFPRRAWTWVSQEYTIAEVLRRVIKSLNKNSINEVKLEKKSEEDLERYLHELLRDSKYLVVVDDVWDRNVWKSLKKSFPDNGKGSRVIVTTRNNDVATRMDGTISAHKLQLLDPKKSLELFLRKLSTGKDWPLWCSPTMQDLGKEMVEKCSGLPLALVVLGGLLAHKQSLGEWHKVREQIWSHLINDSVEISHLFSLSYNDLSNELKNCFLYFGTFPEDYRISSKELSYSWMAEEFTVGEGDMEDIALSHLNELVNRNLIQEEKGNRDVKYYYKIHDLLRDLAIVKASELKLFNIYNPNAIQSSLHRTRSHVFSTPNFQRYVTTNNYNTKLQALTLYNIHGENTLAPPQLIARLGKFNDLTILKLMGFETPSNLLNTIGNLLQLKLLMLSSTGMINLPPSLGNLRRLQTLYIGGPGNLPSEISNLKDLRHLDCGHIEGNVVAIGNLTGLQTLRRISYENWTAVQTKNLINLMHLMVFDIKEQNGKAYSLKSIAMLNNLHKLELRSDDKGFPPLDFISSLHNLSKLFLYGKIEMLPPAEKWPKFLTELLLVHSQLKEDPIPIIEKLSNLRRLGLADTHKSDNMSFSSKCLPQLEIFSLGGLPNLKKLEVGEGTMPIVKHLYICACDNLEDSMVSDQLKSIIISGSPYFK